MLLNYEKFKIYFLELLAYENNSLEISEEILENELALIKNDEDILLNIQKCFDKNKLELLTQVVKLLIIMEDTLAEWIHERKDIDHTKKESSYRQTIINRHHELIELYEIFDDQPQIKMLKKYEQAFQGLIKNKEDVLTDAQVFYILNLFKMDKKHLKQFINIFKSDYFIITDTDDIVHYANFYKLFSTIIISQTDIIKSVLINIYLLYKFKGKKVPVSILEYFKDDIQEPKINMNFSKIDNNYKIKTFYKNFPIYAYGSKKSLVFQKFEEVFQKISKLELSHEKNPKRIKEIKSLIANFTDIDHKLAQQYLIFKSFS